MKNIELKFSNTIGYHIKLYLINKSKINLLGIFITLY